MPDNDGLTLLTRLKQSHPKLPIIIMTAHSDLNTAVNAYQQGAFDYLPKPFDIDETILLVKRALNYYRNQQPNTRSNSPQRLLSAKLLVKHPPCRKCIELSVAYLAPQLVYLLTVNLALVKS